MQITVNGVDVLVSDRVRAYAEYRLFTTVAHYGGAVRGVTVTLGPDRGRAGAVTCAVLIDLASCGVVKTQARGGHPDAAIDRAAARAAFLLGRRTGGRGSDVGQVSQVAPHRAPGR